MLKVVVGIPTRNEVSYDCFRSINRFAAENNIQLIIRRQQERPLYLARNAVVKYFLEETDADYLFFVDSDIVLPDNTMELFIADKDIISAFYPLWISERLLPALLKEKDKDEDERVKLGFLSRWNWDTVEEYEGCGAGCLLIKRHVLEKMSPPWFFTESKDDHTKIDRGEDLFFSIKASEQGFKIWGHTGVRCSHLKTMDLLEVFSLLYSNQFSGYAGRVYQPTKTLRKCYEDYTKTVSVPAWAMSWEASCYLSRLIKSLKPTKILDLGSGWSSYVARTSSNAIVHSVDKSPMWLEKTKRFLKRNNVPTLGFFLAENFRWTTNYDLILLDIGWAQKRDEWFEAIKKHCSGAILVDDLQFKDYHKQVKEAFPKKDYVIFDLLEETIDEFGRYSWLIVPKHSKT